jgi:4-methylaminobutanoate oxidase (formaldehyde-forming)
MSHPLLCAAGFVHWPHDISTKENLLEAGLGFTVNPKLKAGQAFLGREAVERFKEKGANGQQKKLAGFVLDGFDADQTDMSLWGHESLFRDGEYVGYVTSTCYSPSIGKVIAQGYVKNNAGGRATKRFLQEGEYHVLVAGEMVPCSLQLGAVYDPKNANVHV